MFVGKYAPSSHILLLLDAQINISTIKGHKICTGCFKNKRKERNEKRQNEKLKRAKEKFVKNTNKI